MSKDNKSNIQTEAVEKIEMDLASLKFDQKFQMGEEVKKLLTNVPVRKPNKQSFFRVHENEDYTNVFYFIELSEENEIYLVVPEIAELVPQEIVIKTLYTCIDRQGNVFLWPVKYPQDGKLDSWNQSAHDSVDYAKEHWIRLSSNRQISAYEVSQATNTNIPEPKWPEKSFEELVKLAFKDKIIKAIGHPVIKQLKGEE